MDGASNTLVADFWNCALRKVTRKGAVYTLTGNGTECYANGVGEEVRFNDPQGIAVDADRTIYVVDSRNNCAAGGVRRGGRRERRTRLCGWVGINRTLFLPSRAGAAQECSAGKEARAPRKLHRPGIRVVEQAGLVCQEARVTIKCGGWRRLVAQEVWAARKLGCPESLAMQQSPGARKFDCSGRLAAPES